MINWFRSYHGAPTDPKWATIAKRSETQPGVVAAIWWALMDHASQQEDRGCVADFDTETIACAFGWPEEMVIRVVDALRDKGLITDDRLTTWEKRQPKREDHSTERVRRHREKQEASGNAVKRRETPGNAREEKRRVEKKRETPSAAASAASSEEHEEPSRPRRSRAAAVPSPAEEAPRETWLTPARDAWERHKGPGSFRARQAAGLFAPLHQAGLSPEEIGRRLDRYCALRRGKFCTLADFAANHGEFIPPDPSTLYRDGWMSEELERETRPAGARP